MDTISQAACDTATILRRVVPDAADPTRAAHIFNLVRVTAFRSPIAIAGELRRPNRTPSDDAMDSEVIESAIAYARSKGAE